MALKVERAMNSFRYALLANTGERYITLAINFILLALLSRILTPRDIGIAAIGAAALSLIECVRDVPTNYLIQKADIDAFDRQTAFTAMVGTTAIIVVVVLASAHVIAGVYGDSAVAEYLGVLAIALLPGPFERPLMATLRRQVRFADLAIVNIAVVIVNACVTLVLALLGFRYMAFAWGLLSGNITAMVLAAVIAWQPNTYKLNLSRWRSAFSIGGYSTLTDLSARVVELVTYLIVSRGARLDNVGLYSRALGLNMLPEKLFVTGVTQVAFPIISEYARQDRDLKQVLLRGFQPYKRAPIPRIRDARNPGLSDCQSASGIAVDGSVTHLTDIGRGRFLWLHHTIGCAGLHGDWCL